MTRAPDQVIETAEHIEETAAGWVTRIDLHGTPDEWARLDAWLAASPRHRAAFLRLSVAWRRADQLRHLASLGTAVDEDLLDPRRWASLPEEADLAESLPAAPAPADSVVDLASRRTEPHELHMQGLRALGAEPRETVRSLRLSARGSRIAASFIVALVLATGGYVGWQLMNPRETSTYATAVGEFRSIALSDGSVLTLNTDTVATVELSGNHRVVELERGEAVFAVAHDTSRPFDVHAGKLVVRAVGTQFSVRKLDELSADVLVAEGKISINPPSSSTYGVGSYMTVRNGRISATLLPQSDINARLEWTTTQRLSFKGATVSEVVAELNRYNARKIVIQAPGLAEQQIGGSFKARDPEGFVSALENQFPVHARLVSRGSGDIISVEGGAR
jgi:transmembrane sensor